MLSGLKRSSYRASLLNVYKSLILHKLDYGCLAYFSSKNRILNKLNLIQNNALRLSLDAFRTSPIVKRNNLCITNQREDSLVGKILK